MRYIYIYITVCREEGNPEQTNNKRLESNRIDDDLTFFLSFPSFRPFLSHCFLSSRRTNMARLLLSDRDQVSIDQGSVGCCRPREKSWDRSKTQSSNGANGE